MSYSNTIANAYDAAGVLVASATDLELFPLSGVTTTLSGVGITRVDFTGVAAFTNLSFGAGAVPEPATWAMMIGGFGMIGFAMRRRQKVTTRVSYAA